MNISNTSCEYFYDEEYDILKKETYDDSFLNSFNNNIYPCLINDDSKISHLKHDFLTTSRLWSECLLENSENNNYDNLESNIFKCASSDNVIDMSRYSFSNNLPFLIHPGENSLNYRLYFDRRVSTGVKEDFDIRKQFSKKFNSKRFIDSGKCSAATSDSLIHPFKYYRNQLANSENNLHETSKENLKESSIISHRKKSSKQLWRKLKGLFSTKQIQWKKTMAVSKPLKFCRSYSAPSLIKCNSSDGDSNRNNRFSTTVVELYNLLSDLSTESDTVFFEKPRKSQMIQTTTKMARDMSCQCPEIDHIPRKTSAPINRDYPGLGKIKLPQKLRSSVHHFLENDIAFNNLKFLENKSESHLSDIRRSSSANRVRGRASTLARNGNVANNDMRKKTRVPSRCVSESRHKHHYSGTNNQEMSTFPISIDDLTELVIIEENKSLSFSDLRPIPRKCGLSSGDQILAIFEFPSRALIHTKITEYDEESNNRIGELVTNAIAAIKLVSSNLRNTEDLATICDKFVRCKDSNRQSTSALLSAVDSILILISDGLSLDNVRGKPNPPTKVIDTKMAMRMWMFIEESCRSSLIKDVSHKLAFANLLKQVKHICGNTVSDQRSKEWLVQLKLQIFIVNAIKTNLLHVWLRAVVTNDTILHRFFGSCSFFQQARTSFSNALSAVVVEIRRLSTPENSQVPLTVNKPVKGKGRTISNSSSDNSISKSKIPRLSRKLTIIKGK